MLERGGEPAARLLGRHGGDAIGPGGGEGAIGPGIGKRRQRGALAGSGEKRATGGACVAAGTGGLGPCRRVGEGLGCSGERGGGGGWVPVG